MIFILPINVRHDKFMIRECVLNTEVKFVKICNNVINALTTSLCREGSSLFVSQFEVEVTKGNEFSLFFEDVNNFICALLIAVA